MLDAQLNVLHWMEGIPHIRLVESCLQHRVRLKGQDSVVKYRNLQKQHPKSMLDGLVARC